MRALQLACCGVLMAIVLVAAVLTSPAQSQTQSTLRQVYVLRHCVRSTGAAVKYGLPAYPRAENYTNRSLPAWGVPAKYCTPSGVEILEGTGAWLVASGKVPAEASVAFIADTSQRDVDSAEALLRGMGRGGSVPVQTDSPLFDTLDPDSGEPMCASTVSDAAREAATRQRMLEVPHPTSFEDAARLLERLIGTGAAGPLEEMGPPTVTSQGTLVGAIGPLKLFAQNLVYAFASGIPYAWQLASPSRHELYQLLCWQHYLRAVTKMGDDSATANAALLARVFHALEAPSTADDAADALFLLGHDGNLDGLALLLGLRWTAPPYLGSAELIPTPPGSGLRFELDAATIGAGHASPSMRGHRRRW